MAAQPATGRASVVTAAITTPRRSSSEVSPSSSRWTRSSIASASGATAGRNQVASESALTATASGVRADSSSRSPASSRAASSSSSATCVASRSSVSPALVSAIGRLRTTSTWPQARSSARSRWLTADGVSASAVAAPSSEPASAIAASARSCWES